MSIHDTVIADTIATGHSVDAKVNHHVAKSVGLEAKNICINPFFVIGSRDIASIFFLRITMTKKAKKITISRIYPVRYGSHFLALSAKILKANPESTQDHNTSNHPI